jgi:hypothetical protein
VVILVDVIAVTSGVSGKPSFVAKVNMSDSPNPNKGDVGGDSD